MVPGQIEDNKPRTGVGRTEIGQYKHGTDKPRTGKTCERTNNWDKAILGQGKRRTEANIGQRQT